MGENINEQCHEQINISVDFETKHGIEKINTLYQDMNDVDKGLFKSETINILTRGYNILSEAHFDSLKGLLSTMGIISLSQYSEVGNMMDFSGFFELEYKFSLRLDDDIMRVYPATGLSFINPVQSGYMKEGKYYKDFDFFESDDTSDNNVFHLPDSMTRDCPAPTIIGTEVVDQDPELVEHSTEKHKLIISQNQDLRVMNERLRVEQQQLENQSRQNTQKIQELRDKIDSMQCPVDETPVIIERKDDSTNIDNIDQAQQNINAGPILSDQTQSIPSVTPTITITSKSHDALTVSKTHNIQLERESENENRDYIVQSGDTLWKIVKEYYSLTSNRDIANCVNKLVKYNVENSNAGELEVDNTPDGIFGDKIYAGQKILLANELTFRKQKFQLNKEA